MSIINTGETDIPQRGCRSEGWEASQCPCSTGISTKRAKEGVMIGSFVKFKQSTYLIWGKERKEGENSL